MNKRNNKIKLLVAFGAVAVVVLAVPLVGLAQNIVTFGIQAPSSSPMIYSDTGTANEGNGDYVTIRGNLSRWWVNWRGYATNDVTAVGNPPFATSVVIYCGAGQTAYVDGPQTGYSRGTNVLDIACPASQYGGWSQHWGFTDP